MSRRVGGCGLFDRALLTGDELRGNLAQPDPGRYSLEDLDPGDDEIVAAALELRYAAGSRAAGPTESEMLFGDAAGRDTPQSQLSLVAGQRQPGDDGAAIII